MTYPTQKATNADLAHFLGVGDDARRDILRTLGLPKRRLYPWTEIWSAMGLLPEQPEEIWSELMLGPGRSNALWDAARVAEEIGATGATVHTWCRRSVRPTAFPAPLLDLSPKTRRWLPLEVRAFNQPSIHGDLARLIGRRPAPRLAPRRAAAVSWTGTLSPLPRPA